MASVGIVIGDPMSSNCTADEIVRNADVAMYEAKRSGRGCSVVFDAGMHARLTRHVAIETSLVEPWQRRAVSRVPADRGSAFGTPPVRGGARALETSPTMGSISPSEFIPIAEESGLIVAVGQWVLERACRAMVEWRAGDPHHAPAMVSVNLSRAEIALGNRLLEQVQTTLESVGLPPECLQLEVTEREVMRNPEAARDLLGKLRQLGVRLAMDDFGTGTSSLSLLRAYPFNTIKIDRSFLQDLNTSHEVSGGHSCDSESHRKSRDGQPGRRR